MTHDEKCEWRASSRALGYEPEFPKPWCDCADRAIAAARRDGRIEGFIVGRWGVAGMTSHSGRKVAEVKVDEQWPEDKP